MTLGGRDMVRLWRGLLALLAVLMGAVLPFAGSALAAGVWSAPEQVDHAGAAVAGAYLVTCPSRSLCFGANAAGQSDAPPSYGGPLVFHVPASGASGSVLSMGLTIPFSSGDNSVSLLGLQCPSVALCVGLADYNSDDDDEVDVVASTTPAAGPSSWIEEHVSDSPLQVSCPTTTLCVGAGTDGAVVTSEAPASHAWQATKLAAAVVDVDCPSAGFCAAVDTSGNVWTSTDPAGGSGAWVRSGATKPLATAATADAGAGGGGGGDPIPENFSCGGPSLCVAAGPSGTVLVSTDPAGAAAWSPHPVSVGTVTAVECLPAVAGCLAGDDRGDISTSVGPDANAWTKHQTGFGAGIGSGAFVGVGNLSCTAKRCVASPLNSTSPPLFAAVPSDGGAWKWTAFTVATHDPLVGVACPAANECVAADQKRYIASTNPKRGASSWQARTEDDEYGDHDAGTLGMSCYSASGCLAAVDDVGSGGLADTVGGDLASFDPAGGAHTVRLTNVGGVLFVTCAQGACVTGYPGAWLQSAHPALKSGWHAIKAPRFDVTCLRGNNLCVALRDGPFPGTAGPGLLTAPHRAGPWTSKTVDPGGQITGLACTSSRACVVVDAAGRLLVSTHPTGAPATWHLSDTDPYGLNGVSCQNAHSCVAVDNNGGVVIGRP
jgi:hypothetical protein